MSDHRAPASHGAGRERRGLTRAIKESLRDVGAQLSRLNHGVGDRVNIRTSDLECLDQIAREGPLSPTALARLTGQHPATLTGILDRLERDGWIARDRDPGDRRGVVVRVERGRGAEILRLFMVESGMNSALDEILASYTEAELAVVADFMRRTAAAGRIAADRLSPSR
ncbi:MAG: MarR family transcriptional regulator [Actinobacteria bacterium]|nr:MarR family transcriptional regulator [Actinomycetota bacterium]MBO0835886.1 MarR family transcriptional regulator [Actinomycetota bacterium]